LPANRFLVGVAAPVSFERRAAADFTSEHSNKKLNLKS